MKIRPTQRPLAPANEAPATTAAPVTTPSVVNGAHESDGWIGAATREAGETKAARPGPAGTNALVTPLQLRLHEVAGAAKTAALLASALEPALFPSSVLESDAIKARRLEFVGAFHGAVVERGASPTSLVLRPKDDAGIVQDGQRYVERTNATSLLTTDPRTGQAREFIIPRGVRPYRNELDEPAHVLNKPTGYVSDVLLYERIGDVLVPLAPLLLSSPEHDFRFEDPRISVFIDDEGKRRILLSGTDYAPHTPNSSDPDVMNRYVELMLDDEGRPKPVAVDANGRPAFRDLSPAPRLKADGGYAFLDAKNAVVATNEDGHLVVRTRFRPQSDDPAFAAHPGVKPWGYGEQVFVFTSFDEMQSYDWSHALDDVLAGHAGRLAQVEGRVRPLQAKLIAIDDTFHELYPKNVLAPGKGKGFGPGTAPVRVRRVGDEVFLSEGKGAPERNIGVVPASLQKTFPLADGAVTHLTFDHEVRYCVDRRASDAGPVDAIKRVYSASIKQWDAQLTTLKRVYADVIQPLQRHQRTGSGILDLHHTYPMGRVILNGLVRVTAGECDAHTASYDFDVMQLLAEMADGGAREATGQVYRPSAPPV